MSGRPRSCSCPGNKFPLATCGTKADALVENETVRRIAGVASGSIVFIGISL